ncbi:MAG: T9SS type A sorting domain-containing protein, partial [Bacteroidetes bacterium]|nr:T9SS type A sorting domain-containing protein [Bacteroidota bacterium]
TWYYRFYTENNSYYSEYNAMAAASETTDSTGCEFTVNLGGDTSICGSGAVLLNPGIVISPNGDSLTITYNATSGVSGLAGATSVYMHSGAELHTGGGWQYPIGNWGMDDGLGKMTNVGQDLWQITINPVNYYGYNADSILHGIFMVFRNDDGSLTGKNELNDDIWAGMNPVYCGFSGVSLSFDPNEYDQITWSDGSHGNTLTATTSGTYYVTIESVYGCSASDTIEVGLNSLPVVEIGDDTTVCNGDSLVLDAGTGFTTYLWNDASTGTTLTIDSSGIYSVTVTNAAGCSGMDVVFVELLSSPVAGFTTSANGLTIDFTDISTDGETYEWDFNNDGTPESTTAGDVSYTFPGAGQFYVSLEVTNACGTDTYSQLILVNSIHDYSSDASFDVFPNPANDKLNIQVVLPESQDFRLLLQDVNGRTLYFGEEDYRKDAGNYTIDISRFAPGVYILKFESNSLSLITKIIIE